MPGEAPSVKVEVRRCHQEAWGRVQADAEAPDVALRREAEGCADGREVVVDLERKLNLGVRKVFRSSVTASNNHKLRQKKIHNRLNYIILDFFFQKA